MPGTADALFVVRQLHKKYTSKGKFISVL